jgi:hypothetical protein
MQSFLTPVLTTLGKYSTAQLIAPPLLLFGVGGTAKYAYDKYKATWAVRKTHHTPTSRDKLLKHNALMDAMRAKFRKPTFKYVGSSPPNKDYERQQKAMRNMWRGRHDLDKFNAKREFQNAARRREAARRSDDRLRQLEQKDARRRAIQATRARWNPTNWFRGKNGSDGKPNGGGGYSGGRGKKPGFWDDFSPFSHGGNGPPPHHGGHPHPPPPHGRRGGNSGRRR